MFVNRARYRGNELIDGKLEAVASTKGTSITVDDLFYTIPSRQTMYLGKESEETKHIWSIFSKKKSEDSQKKKQTGNTEEKTAEALSLKKEDKTEPEPSAKEPTESNKGGE